ncbi:MAG: hypothetical protein KJ955_01405 [Nanoarchaeota archaeon]|nr:hypothetical protein [Nanoarchaeota archaeon]
MGLITKLLDKLDAPPKPEMKDGYPYVKCKLWNGSAFADAELKTTELNLFGISHGHGFQYFSIANDPRVYAIINTAMKFLYDNPVDSYYRLESFKRSCIALPPYYFVLCFAKQLPVVEEIPKDYDRFTQFQSLISEPDWGHSVLETKVTTLSHRQAKKAAKNQFTLFSLTFK